MCAAIQITKGWVRDQWGGKILEYLSIQYYGEIKEKLGWVG